MANGIFLDNDRIPSQNNQNQAPENTTSRIGQTMSSSRDLNNFLLNASSRGLLRNRPS